MFQDITQGSHQENQVEKRNGSEKKYRMDRDSATDHNLFFAHISVLTVSGCPFLCGIRLAKTNTGSYNWLIHSMHCTCHKANTVKGINRYALFEILLSGCGCH